MNYYIYYRAARGGDELKTRVRNFQTALARETGSIGSLLRKDGDPATWMEIYNDVGDTKQFERALRRLVEEYRLEESLDPDTQRHIERFEPL